jgi:hypothetical protein
MKPVFFTIAGDPQNLHYAKMMEASLKRFHPDIPLVVFGENEIKETKDPAIFYRATPVFGRILLDKYDLAIKIDADSIVTGNLDHVLKDETYDMGNVLNWNRVDQQMYQFPLTVWDIPIEKYMNCGLVAMRSLKLVEHWLKLCYSEKFDHYRFREQDLMNILYWYGNYNVKCFDWTNNWHGIISKGEWMNLELAGNEIVLPPVNGYPDETKTIKVIHMAGGQIPDKMNIQKLFKGEVQKRLLELTHYEPETQTK